MKKIVNIHSYIKRKPVQGATCRGTIKKANPRDTTEANKQTQTETMPKYAGTLL